MGKTYRDSIKYSNKEYDRKKRHKKLEPYNRKRNDETRSTRVTAMS